MTTQADNKSRADVRKDEKPVGEIVTPKRKPKSKAAKGVGDVITGDILSNRKLRRWYPLAIYCCLLVLIFIWHTFNHQRVQRIEIKQRMTLNEERSRSVIFSSIRMNASRHSKVLEEIERRGIPLEESRVPPKKIEI